RHRDRAPPGPRSCAAAGAEAGPVHRALGGPFERAAPTARVQAPARGVPAGWGPGGSRVPPRGERRCTSPFLQETRGTRGKTREERLFRWDRDCAATVLRYPPAEILCFHR